MNEMKWNNETYFLSNVKLYLYYIKHTIISVKLAFLMTPSYRNKNSTPHYYHCQKTIKGQIIRSRQENEFVRYS